MIAKGQIYRLDKEHYCFVLSDPIQFPDAVVIVNMTTFHGTAGEDESCLIGHSDHTAISHQSWMFYQKAFIFTAKQIAHRERTGMIAEVLPDICSAPLLARIIEGAIKSNRTPKKIMPP